MISFTIIFFACKLLSCYRTQMVQYYVFYIICQNRSRFLSDRDFLIILSLVFLSFINILVIKIPAFFIITQNNILCSFKRYFPCIIIRQKHKIKNRVHFLSIERKSFSKTLRKNNFEKDLYDKKNKRKIFVLSVESSQFFSHLFVCLFHL